MRIVSTVIAFKLGSVGGKCGKEQVLITGSTVQGFAGRYCVLLGGAAPILMAVHVLLNTCKSRLVAQKKDELT